MKILAIETSCDDTCVSILEAKKGDLRFLSSIISSQIEVHRQWGGVYPTLAKREHQKNLVPTLKEALLEADMLESGKTEVEDSETLSDLLVREEGLEKRLSSFFEDFTIPQIDYIAVTVGPGLDPSLWAGINFAKSLSLAWNKPIIAVNHIEAHFLAPLIINKGEFPSVSLLASGGHTQLIVSQSLSEHEVVGKTRDDAAGECFDKTARILGLDYPGGPEIAKLAKEETTKEVKLPRPMLRSKDYDFSFSGLKTAVLYRWKEEKNRDREFKIAMAKEIQESITEVLTLKTFKAVEEFNAKTVVVGGGVSANKRLRERIRKKGEGRRVILPDLDFSTDNAKMIAVTAHYKIKEGEAEIADWKSLKSRPNLKIN